MEIYQKRIRDDHHGSFSISILVNLCTKVNSKDVYYDTLCLY